LEQLSVSFVTPHFRRHHGGTGANIAWHLKLLGEDPLLVGTVGNDGGTYLSLLRERGIATEHIEELRDHLTATAIVATDSAERQIAFFHPGADSFGRWPDLGNEQGEIAFAVVSSRSIPLMVRGIEWCMEEKVPLLFDPGQQVHGFGDDELKRSVAGAKGVIVNAYESALLQARLRSDERELAARVSFLIVTRGEEGFTLYEGSKRMDFPACVPDRVVNPTGAGDAFRSGLLTGLIRKWPLPEAAKLGAAMGSFVVEQEGTLLDQVDTDEVWARAERAYGTMLPTKS
jgi:adenosine kinase